MARIILPALLKHLIKETNDVIIEGGNLQDILTHLITKYSVIKPYIFDSLGKIHSSVLIYLNNQDIRYLDLAKTPVSAADILTIIPALAGG